VISVVLFENSEDHFQWWLAVVERVVYFAQLLAGRHMFSNTVWCYCAACFVVHYVAAFFVDMVRPNLFPQALDKSSFPNRAVALVNALYLGGTALMYMPPRLLVDFSAGSAEWVTVSEETLGAFGPFEEWNCDCLMGYLIHDTLWYLFMKVGKIEADIMIHHGLGLASWYSVRHTRTGGMYMLWTHMSELSTPFLHLSWLTVKLNLQKTWRFWFATRGCLVAFLVFRVVSIFFCTLHMYRHGADHFQSSLMYYYQVTTCFLFWCLNLLWFYLLVSMAKTDVIKEAEDKFSDSAKQKKAK